MTSVRTRVLVAGLATYLPATSIACAAAPRNDVTPPEHATEAQHETMVVPAQDAGDATPATSIQVADTAASIVQSGCAFEGNAVHAFTMSVDGSTAGTFASLERGSVRLRFGERPDDPIEFHAVVERFSFDVQAAASSVSLYSRGPVTYQGVFDALPNLPLRVEASRIVPGALRVMPRSWEGPKAVVFHDPKPWILGCDRFSISRSTYRVAQEPVRAIGTLVTAGDARVMLSAEIGGPAVLSVHSGTRVELLRTMGAWAKIAWDTEDGRFHGFIKRSQFDGGAGLFGRGRGTGHGSVTACTATAPLYVLRRGTRVLVPVGTMLAGAAATLETRTAADLHGADHSSYVRVLEAPGVELRGGFELYVAEGEASRCLRAR